MSHDHHLAVGAPAQPADDVRQLLLLAVHVREEPLPRSLEAEGPEARLDDVSESRIAGAPRPPVREPLRERAGVRRASVPLNASGARSDTCGAGREPSENMATTSASRAGTNDAL